MKVSYVNKSGSHLQVRKSLSHISQYVCYSGNTASSCSSWSIRFISQPRSQIRHAIGLLVTCSITESFTGSLYKKLINPVSESNSTRFFSSHKEFTFLQTRGKHFSSLTGLKTVWVQYYYNTNSISNSKNWYSFKIFLRFWLAKIPI